MNEQEVTRILQLDLSIGTEAFRDALLQRCLAVLDTKEVASLDDDELDLLAAAGNPADLFTETDGD